MRIARLICSLLLAVGMLAIPVQSRAQVAVGISVRVGPPVLPVYVQPICPEPGYIWVPGYWAYGPDDYFWVPGTWAEPPEIGLLWTPGYWGWQQGLYVWYPGYWGPEVGYYGGINYGFGYTGVGFFGGYWQGRTYYYNRAVTNVDVAVVRNTYNTTVINNSTNNYVSYNGGPGGTSARPTSTDMAAARQHHVQMTSMQMQHQQAASTNRELRASVNHGRPEVPATARPGQFNGHDAMASSRAGNSNRPPENMKETNRPENPSMNTGPGGTGRPPSNASPVNPALERKQQQEMEKMRQQQDAERQKMDKQHNQEQQKLARQRTDQPRQEQLQQRQQQQLQQMQQKHDQQSHQLQERQQREVQKQQKQGNEKEEPKDNRPPGR